MTTDTFERPQATPTPPGFGRTRRVFRVLRQGRYGRRTVRIVSVPVDGTVLLARTYWRWIKADDYAGTDDLKFLESVRTRRRRTAWMVGGGYVLSSSLGAYMVGGSAAVLAAGAVVSVGTAAEAVKRVKARPRPFAFPGKGKGGTPGEDLVVRAAIAAKLGRAEGMRLASPVLAEDGGWSTVLQLAPGDRARACLGKEGAFASALGTGEPQVFFQPLDEHAGQLAVFVAKADPFLRVYPSPFIGRTEPWDFWQGIPAGVNGRGGVEWLRLVDASLIVAGEPRAGKSAAVNGILAAAALAPTVRMHLWDGKGAGDHRPWRRIAHTAEKRNAQGLLAHLKKMQAQMERVFDMLDEVGGPTRLTPDLCRQLGIDVELTVVDETRYYVSSPWGEEIVEAMVDIASRGPAAGVLLVLATQRTTKEGIPPKLKGVCSLRWAMRCADSTASNAVLGPGAVGAGYDASDIPRSHRGVGILDADGADPSRLRSYFLDDEGTDLVDVAAVAYELRRAAGTLPPAEQEVAADPAEEILAAMGEADRMHTGDLVEALGPGWSAARIAQVLKPYGIGPGQVVIDGINRNGYRRADLEALFAAV
ncbi:FtsK/SpoIIIE domain-containing protein [Nonomuraea indica]|uniref:FtsK/SpoIIIE domain-containing protein n=1 Tax=Nonomuraea indica TaxID=1581193 RepID=UPI000C7DA778|nr:FtsK/SpoIIIE domain-containing protein [Nonomuraea indica]